MKRSVLIASAFLLILASCRKKEYPQNVSESPEFYVSAKIDGQPITLQAGTLGYYMFSSYSQSIDGIYSFIADVKPQNCGSACPNSLRIELNDNIMASQGGASNVSNSVKTGSYTFVNSNASNPTLIGYMVSYGSSFNLSPISYDWNFGVGANDVIANPTHTYSAPGVYNTRLTAIGNASPPAIGTGSIENPVKVTLNTNVCRTRVVVSNISANTVTFNNVTSGSGNYTWNWDFGDGSQNSPDAMPVHTFPGIGIYQVKLTTIDHTHMDTAVHFYNARTDMALNAAPNFWVNSVNGIYSNSPLSKIKITYTDGSGKIFTSDVQPQTGSNFNIVSVQEYKNNENNQPTKKLKITFNCTLYGDGITYNLTDGEAVIAVAYK
jgi:PKD repeat protein